MSQNSRLPSLPIAVSDPYFSIWCAADTLTGADTCHWSGAPKPLRGEIKIDGQPFRFLGEGDLPAMETAAMSVTPTATRAIMRTAGVELKAGFLNPALPDDLDTLTTPVAMIDLSLSSLDGKAHDVTLTFSASGALCYDGGEPKPLTGAEYSRDGLNFAFAGRLSQGLLCHSADHITIDWGYMYIASALPVTWDNTCLSARWSLALSPEGEAKEQILLGYDDVASILYFGSPCKAWYARNGASLPGAMAGIHSRYGEILAACEALDERVLADARKIGGADYELIVSAAWRHVFGAHKIIAAPGGEMAMISKENDSNGCAGTVDVSYPSTPLFLKYCPKLAEALCLPALTFASMPVWEEDFAPHDVGRYPIVNGQVYACKVDYGEHGPDCVMMPYYLYPAGTGVYDFKYQMPVEECGNMIIMMAAAARATGDYALAARFRPLLDKWVNYLAENGEDPGEQLCTDDFMGHLARNVNLSAKAIVGIACYGRLLAGLGEDGASWERKAKEMAQSWLARANTAEATALTFDGTGWSLKYNFAWDLVMGLGLLPKEFYARETESYLTRLNKYGLPLDSRGCYSKSDWMVWAASMAQDPKTFAALISPLARFLRETPSRVPFTDYFDTVTGKKVGMIARSVQGGLFMPMLREWE